MPGLWKIRSTRTRLAKYASGEFCLEGEDLVTSCIYGGVLG